MRIAKYLVLMLTVAAFAASEASAQAAHTRQGFWFGAGLGAGSLGCEGCDRETGFSGQLAAGGTLSQKLLLGVSSNGWTKSVDGNTITVGSFTALARFYPSATGPFYMHGGLGLGTASIENSGITVSETGFAGMLGVGYDIRVGQNVSLAPYWNWALTSFEGGDFNFAQIGLGVTVH